MLIVWGRRVHTHYDSDREALCGRCLEKTTQAVLSLEERSHIYFIEYGSGVDLGRLAQCQRCKNVVPILARASDAPKRTKAERWMDAFLEAHLLELERADKSTAVGVLLVLSVMVALTLLVWVAVTFGGSTAAVLGLVLLVAGVWAYRRAAHGVGDWVFASAVRTRLSVLCQKAEITPRDLARRAHVRGYERLGRHFDLARYAPALPRADAGPEHSPSAPR